MSAITILRNSRLKTTVSDMILINPAQTWSQRKKSFELEDYKWPIVQAYYAILHASNALIRSKGYRVKDHYCVYLFLVKLADRGLFDSSLAHGYFSAYKDRHKANYDGLTDKATAERTIELAERFQEWIFKELKY